jgi:hypothetical protein
MTRVFHLGLLENDSLIVLRLDGNISMNEREMYLVRGKLKANRDRYVTGYATPVLNPVSCYSSKSERRSESGACGPQLSFKSAEKASNYEDVAFGNMVTRNALDSGVERDVRAQHDRTLSDLGDGEKSGISNLFKPLPVVATRILTCDVSDDVPVSRAFFPSDTDGVPSAALADHDQEDSRAQVMATQQICVLFSAPLAWTDTRNQLHPIQTLDYPGERETLIQAFREASRDIGVRFDFATTDTLRTAISLGVKVLHFSGHGHPHW